MQTRWLDACSQLVQASSWRQEVGKLALNMGIVTTTREKNRIRAINSSFLSPEYESLAQEQIFGPWEQFSSFDLLKLN